MACRTLCVQTSGLWISRSLSRNRLAPRRRYVCEKLCPCQEQGHIRYQLQAWNATSGERGSQLLVEQSILKHRQAVNFSANFKEQPVAVQTTWPNGCDFRNTENCEPPVESMGSNLFWVKPSGDLLPCTRKPSASGALKLAPPGPHESMRLTE